MVDVYTDPGGYVEEVIAQGAITLGTVPLAVTLIGMAAANRVITNEAVVRGEVSQSGLTFTLVGGQYQATVAVASNQSIQSTTLFLNDNQMPVGSFAWVNATTISISSQYFNANYQYVIDYVAPSQEQDALLNAGATQIDSVGSFSGIASFKAGVDYQLTGGKVDWSLTAPATLAGIPAGPFDLSANFNLAFSLDSNQTLTVNCQGATPAATTAAEVIAKLNTALNASSSYGLPYMSAASIGTGGNIVLTGVTEGSAGSIVLSLASANPANLAIFGIANTALPLTVLGVGSEPALGSTYYVTYEIPRPDTDFLAPMQFFSSAAAYAVVGYPDITNPMGNYVNLCFKNGAPSVYCVITEQNGSGGTQSTDQDFINGIAASETDSAMTEIVPISTSLNVQIALYQSVINMSSLLNRKRRRGWFGMARGTPVGDMDTPGSAVYMAAVTLQVPGNSPGRGRFVLMYPSECSSVITLQNGQQVTMNFDGTALAAATASVLSGFTSAATSLMNATLQQFTAITSVDTPTRQFLTPNGVCVVSLKGGIPILLDPMTTEAGGGGLEEFEEISVGVQKDKVAVLIEEAVDSDLVGIVPDDLSDFINDIKEVVGLELKAIVDSGDIGKYTNSDGSARDVNFQTDVIAAQSATDKEQFTFGYWFNGRYPAKRFFGQFSVDNPFFVASQQGQGS